MNRAPGYLGARMSGGKIAMNDTFGGIMASRAVPPWLPRDAQDARMFSYWAQVLFFIMALIWFVIGIAWIAIGISETRGGTIAFGFVGLIVAIVCGLAGVFLKRSVIDDIDHGRFHDAKMGCIVWGIIGVAAFIMPTIILLLAYMKLSDLLIPHAPQYSPYAPGTAVGQQPPQQPYPQAPPQQQPAVQPQQQAQPQYQHGKDQKYQMIKCKNCGVQFPAFMANCPNCGAPKD